MQPQISAARCDAGDKPGAAAFDTRLACKTLTSSPAWRWLGAGSLL